MGSYLDALHLLSPSWSLVRPESEIFFLALPSWGITEHWLDAKHSKAGAGKIFILQENLSKAASMSPVQLASWHFGLFMLFQVWADAGWEP